MIRQLLINQDNQDKIAIIEGDKEVSYLDLINKARAIQSFLTQRKWGNIAIMLPNSGDYIAAFWGIVISGMTAFPLNVLMTRREMVPLLKYADVRIMIASTIYRSILEEMAELEDLSLKIVYMEELNTSSCGNGFMEIDVGSDEPMVLLNTSGTTGKCKIVQLSERNVEASVLGYMDKLHLEEMKHSDSRFILAAPFSSAYGIMILTACLINSFPIVLLEQTFTLDSFYRIAEKHKVTHYEGGDSTILLMEKLIGKPIPYDISALTCFGFGGSKIFSSTIEKLHSGYKGKYFFQGYGMTEAGPLITKHPIAKVEKMESVGTAIKGMDIAIEADNRIVKTPYIKGEIVVRGSNVMLGYYENESETKRMLKNGYLYTGDIGYLDEEGYLYISGRKKNIIIIRGFNVYPEEVEECIQSSLYAKDCIVYGQTDALGNEIVCADIVPINSQVQVETIRMYCNDHLTGYKRPQKISFCENIRKNMSGKSDRRKGDSL